MNKKKILIVDDDSDFVELIKLRLEHAGYKVYTASSGEEGVEKFSKEKPDLILLDIFMPGIDGFEMLYILKNNYPNTEHLPVIMITARNELESSFKAKGFGATDYLVKPIDTQELLDKISEHISRLAGNKR